MRARFLLALVVAGSAHAQNRLPPGMRPPGCTAGLQLPEGFCATLFAIGVDAARHIVVAPNGDVFVNTMARDGKIVALRDTNRDGKADIRQKFGGGGGTGIALDGNNYLYANSYNSIVRYRLGSGSLTPIGKPDTIVTGLPLTGQHHANNFVLQGRSLFVNIGSATNVCQAGRQGQSPGLNPCTELNTRAGIWEFDATRLRQQLGDGKRFATGLRNSVAFTRNPLDGYLYAAVHGRDQLHDNFPQLFTVQKSAENPGEEFVRVDRGADYGWPYCYYDVDRRALVLAPEYGGDGQRTGQCAGKTPPLIAFPGHWAPESVLFYTGGQFPSQYRGGAFISFHGSWNRAPLPQEGFRVVFAPFRFDRPTGSYTTFADGFNPTHREEGPGVRRPMGLAQGPDGSLYITDDAGGNIWKVTYRGTSR